MYAVGVIPTVGWITPYAEQLFQFPYSACWLCINHIYYARHRLRRKIHIAKTKEKFETLCLMVVTIITWTAQKY